MFILMIATMAFTSKAFPQSPATHLYWTGSGSIFKIDLESGAQDTIAQDVLGGSGELEVSAQAGKLYWSDGRGTLRSSNLDGSKIDVLEIPGIIDPTGIAVDSVNQKIYWMNGRKQAGFNDPTQDPLLVRTDLDGLNAETILDTELVNPLWLRLDAEDGYMVYWDDTVVWRATLNGTDRVPIADSTNSLLLDPVTDTIYWTDLRRTLYKSDVEGTGVEVVLEESTMSNRLDIQILPGTDSYIFADFGIVARFSIDETVKDTLHKANFFNYAAALDYSTNDVFFGDGGQLNRLNLLERVTHEVILNPVIPTRLVTDSENGLVYWHDLNRIFKYNFKTEAIEKIYSAALGGSPQLWSRTLAFDPLMQEIYFDPPPFQSLFRLNITTGDTEPVPYTLDIGLPFLTGHLAEHVLFDEIERLLYWSNGIGLFRSDRNAVTNTVLSTDGFSNIDQFFLDHEKDDLYWFTFPFGTPTLYRSKPDLTEREALTSLRDPEGLAFDRVSRYMYWNSGNYLLRSSVDDFAIDTLALVDSVSIGTIIDGLALVNERAVDQLSDSPWPQTALPELTSFPNPFIEHATILYSTDRPQRITITVFDMLGREVLKLYDGEHLPGNHRIEWDGITREQLPAPAGTYIIRLKAETGTSTKLTTKIR